MATLEEYQKEFVEQLDSDFEEFLSNGHTFQGSQEILPMYKYRDPDIFGSNLMLTQLDPTYPPFDTINPTRKEALKSSYLGLIASFLRKALTFKKTASCQLLNGSTTWGNPDIDELMVTRYFDGTVEIKGIFRTGGTVNNTDPAFRLPSGFPAPNKSIFFNTVSNNATTRMELNRFGQAVWVGTLPSTSNWSYVYLSYRP
jgi:hypothetical protein